MDQTSLARSLKGHAATAGVDKWILIQENTFKNWVNEQLRTGGMSVENLETDFDSGVRLCALIEALQGKRIRVIKTPRNPHQQLENVSQALNAIANDNIRLVNIGPADIVNGNLKLILGLIWHLILRYQIGKSKFPTKKIMIAWLQAVIPDCSITNFTSDWNDGVALHALIDFCRPGLCPNWRSLSRRNGLDNCRAAMTLANKHFDIPLVVRPEDLASPDLDELSGMTYLSYFMKLDSPGYHATLGIVRRLLRQGTVHNFTSDWSDGRLLCHLVKSVGGDVEGYPTMTGDAVEDMQRGMDGASKLGISPILTAREMTDPEVDHIGIMAYAAYFNSFKPVRSAAEKAVFSSLPSNVFVGQEATFSIHLEDDDVSAGDVRADVQGPDSRHTVRFNWVGRTGEGSFVPTETGLHKLNVYCENSMINGCPASFKVLADRSKITFRGVDRCALGHLTELQVNSAAAGQGEVRIEARAPNGRTINLTPVPRMGNYISNFNPTEVGDWEVSVQYDGEHISGSPFTVSVYDPSAVRVYGLEGGTVGQGLTFNADASRAGQGDVRCEVRHSGHTVYSRVVEERNGLYKIDFTPEGPGSYQVSVYFNDEEVRGSPYTLDIADASNVTVAGEGLSLVPVNRTASFEVDPHGATHGKVECEISAPNGDSVKADIYKKSDGEYKVEWTPRMPGRHTVDVHFGGRQIDGSPFYVDVFDLASIRIDNFRHGTVGEDAGFSVDYSQAGSLDLDVKIVNPSGHDVSYDHRELGQRWRDYVYEPEEPGMYQIYVKFGGFTIPGSPFTQEVGDGGMPSASGSGLSFAEEDKTAHFNVQVGRRKGNLSVDVSGPNSMAKVNTEPLSDGSYEVTYVPVETGIFDVNIMWNNVHIPGSPYHPKVVDIRKVRVVGGWQHFMDSSERINLVVGETKQLPFDISEAGPGILRAEVDGPTGSLDVNIDKHTIGRNTVMFTPEEEGNHYVRVFWSDLPIVNSPFLGYAIQQSHDANKVILTGRGLKEAMVREEAHFIIDGSQAGKGSPDVVLSGVRAEVPVKVTPQGNGKFHCSYNAVVPGAYLLHITWNNRQLRGSPYKVNVIGAFYANKVVVLGDGLRGGFLGRTMTVNIDTRKAGPGELTAYCMGPHQVAYCELEDNRDGTFRLGIKPQESGHHVLQIKYGGEHVQGSPFQFKVTAQPDASKVRVHGPGVEHGILATFVSRFVVETRGAGAGQLTVRIKGPKGGFQVEMYRDSQRDRTILCRYDPTEVGLYLISVKWSNVDVPGSPFHVQIMDTQQELEQALNESSFSVGGSFHSSRVGYNQWRDNI